MAQYFTGIHHEIGVGIPQDYIQAYMWFAVAASKGDSRGIEGLSRITEKMTPAQIAEGKRLAREWKPKKL